MTAVAGGAIGDLLRQERSGVEPLGDGAALLPGFARAEQEALYQAVLDVAIDRKSTRLNSSH